MDSRRTRERPIELGRKLPVIRDASGVTFEEDGSNAPGQDRKEKKIVELPIPESGSVENYGEQIAARTAAFQRTVGYIRRPARPPYYSADEYVEYDLELDDLAWLRNHARWGERGDPNSILPAATFEFMVTLMERAAGARGHADTDRMPKADMEKVVAEALYQWAHVAAGAQGGGTGASTGAGAIAGATSDGHPGNDPFAPPAAPTIAAPPRIALPDGLSVIPGSSSSFRAMFSDVYEWWMARRKKIGKPLLRRFWPQTSTADNNPHHTFRPHEKNIRMRRTRRNDADAVRKMDTLLQDVKHASKVLRWVREREALKKAFFDVREEMREQAIAEICVLDGAPKRVPPIIEPTRALLQRVTEMMPTKKMLKLKQPMLKAPERAAGLDEGAEGEDASHAGGAGTKKKLVLSMPAEGAGRNVPAGAGGSAQGPPTKKLKLMPVAEDALRKQTKGGPKTGAAAALADPLYPGHAAYPGFRLGPWSPPASLSLHPSLATHTEEASVEAEEPLWLAHALGLRSFLPAIPRDAEAARARLEVPAVLPSGNDTFPSTGSDQGKPYTLPPGVYRPGERAHEVTANDVYYADLSIQRRYYNLHISSQRWAGGLAWEEGWATGLAAGLGGGVRHDGSGWETQGQRLESTFLPLEEMEGSWEDEDDEEEDEEEEDGEKRGEASAGASTGGSEGQAPAGMDVDGQGQAVPPTPTASEGTVQELSKGRKGKGALLAAAVARANAELARALEDLARVKAAGAAGGPLQQGQGQPSRAQYAQETAATQAAKVAKDREQLASVQMLAYEGRRGVSARMREYAAMRAKAASSSARVHGEESGGDADLTYRFRLARGGRLVVDRVRAPALLTRPELDGGTEDALHTLGRRAGMVQAQRAGMLRQWGLPASQGMIDALGTALPSSLSLVSAYKVIADGGAGGRFGWGDGSRAPGGLEPTRDGVFSRATRRTGVTTTYLHGTLQAPSPEAVQRAGVKPLPSTDVLKATTLHRLRLASNSATAANAGKAVTVVSGGVSALFSVEVDDLLSEAGLSVAGATPLLGLDMGMNTDAGAGGPSTPPGSSSGSMSRPVLVLPGGEAAVLRSAALRFAAGTDPAPLMPRSLFKRQLVSAPSTMQPASTSLPLPDGRFSELWGDADSDNEEVVHEQLGRAMTRMYAPQGIAAEAMLRPHLEIVPLQARGLVQ